MSARAFTRRRGPSLIRTPQGPGGAFVPRSGHAGPATGDFRFFVRPLRDVVEPMNSRRFFHASVRLLALLLSCWSYLGLSADRLDLKIRTRSETAPGSGRYESAEKTV